MLPPNGWKIVSLQPDQNAELGLTRNSRSAKILPHRYLKQYDRSLYIDANLQVTGSLRALFARLDDVPALYFQHPEGRSDIYGEADACIRLGKDDPVVLKKQVARYRELGFDGRAAKHHALIPAGMAMLRRHNDPLVRQAMEDWWSEYLIGSQRDQISLPFALRQSGVKFDLIAENVRQNEWFVWQPHFRRRSTISLMAAYQQASAIILHVNGAETRLRQLLRGAKPVAETRAKRSHRRTRRLFPRPIVLDDNLLGVSPHGAPALELIGSEIMMERPVALLCDDPALYETHALASAEARGIHVQDKAAVLSSAIYGVERRVAFEEHVKTFLSKHPGPKAILHQQHLASGDLSELFDWLGAQGKPRWSVKLRSWF